MYGTAVRTHRRQADARVLAVRIGSSINVTARFVAVGGAHCDACGHIGIDQGLAVGGGAGQVDQGLEPVGPCPGAVALGGDAVDGGACGRARGQGVLSGTPVLHDKQHWRASAVHGNDAREVKGHLPL
jgi:hypothetical protein